MSIWGKLGGAAAGLALGGPLGALVGAFAGHFLLDRESSSSYNDDQEQIAFTVGVIALGAKMAKADGVVTRDEVNAFKQVFKVPPAAAKQVAGIFDLAKQDVAGYEAYARQLANIFAGKPQTLEAVIDGLFHIAKADGIIHPSELEYLQSVAEIFGFSERDFEYIAARHIRMRDQADPYKVLGLRSESSDEEVKKTYRNLVRENHPDRLIAQGVPEELIKIANDKLAKINEAYDEISKRRGF